MKIGILTMYSADYGSYYHATGLYKTIKNLGYDPQLLNDTIRIKYKFDFLIAIASYNIIPNFIKKIIRKHNMRYNTFCILRNELKKYMSNVFFDISKISPNYDCIIVGSDEVWSFGKFYNVFVKECFGIGIKCPHISYSSSGPNRANITNKRKDIIVKGFSTFKSIAVRENLTKEWVDEYTGRDVPVVMDPALLNPYYIDEIKNSGKNYEVKDKFIAVYGEHFCDEQINAIVNFAKKENYKLKSLAWRHKWCDEFAVVHSAIELQEEFYKSSYCCSSSLHGTIFCIAHNKQFVFFPNEVRGPKTVELLYRFNLSDRIYNGNDDIFYTKIDYEITNKVVDEFRQFSLNYLKNALKEIEKDIKGK